MRLCVTVVQSSKVIEIGTDGEAGMQITIIVHYCDSISVFYVSEV